MKSTRRLRTDGHRAAAVRLVIDTDVIAAAALAEPGTGEEARAPASEQLELRRAIALESRVLECALEDRAVWTYRRR